MSSGGRHKKKKNQRGSWARDRAIVDDLLLGEIEREQADNAARQANAITRVSIVIAANAVVVLPVFSGALNLSTMTGLQWLIPLAPALASSVVGFAAIRLWQSEAMGVTESLANAWRSGTPAQVRGRLIDDRLHELEKARSDLRRKNTLYNWAAVLLVATLALEMLVFVLTWCGCFRTA